MEEDMIFEEQTEQESTVEEVQTDEEQTEQGTTNSLDDILAGVNELLISIHALLAESDSAGAGWPTVPFIPALGRGLSLIISLLSCAKIPVNIMLHFATVNTVISCIMGMI